MRSKFLYEGLMLGGAYVAQMPAIQTTYATRISPAFEGMIADESDQTVDALVVETAAGIGFGKVCVQGTADRQIRVSEAARKFRGITVAQHFVEGLVGATPDLYPQYATAAVLVAGAIWVTASVAVAVGDPAYFVPATGVITNVATSNTLIPNSQFESSTSGSGLAILRFRIA